VLVSVLTSAFITSAVEWLAKPQREAPKERLLACAARGEPSKKPSYILGNAANLATGATHGIPRGIEEELRRPIRAEADRAATQIQTATEDMSNILWTTC
jgi:hypothetical protein